jgi:hypothetical protein
VQLAQASGTLLPSALCPHGSFILVAPCHAPSAAVVSRVPPHSTRVPTPPTPSQFRVPCRRKQLRISQYGVYPGRFSVQSVHTLLYSRSTVFVLVNSTIDKSFKLQGKEHSLLAASRPRGRHSRRSRRTGACAHRNPARAGSIHADHSHLSGQVRSEEGEGRV